MPAKKSGSKKRVTVAAPPNIADWPNLSEDQRKKIISNLYDGFSASMND